MMSCAWRVARLGGTDSGGMLGLAVTSVGTVLRATFAQSLVGRRTPRAGERESSRSVAVVWRPRNIGEDE